MQTYENILLYFIRIVVLIVFIILILYKRFSGPEFGMGHLLCPKTKNTYCVLLSTCVIRPKLDVDKQEELIVIYRRTINSWLKETNLPIFVVDSSGYKFEEFKRSRLQVCSFNLTQDKSSTFSEASSVLYALSNCLELKNYDVIVKVTGRYYIPEFENILKNVVGDEDLYLQKRRSMINDAQNSEVFGFKREIGEDIFTPLVQDGNIKVMEERLMDLSKIKKYRRFPHMSNMYKVRRGGDGYMLIYL
jgi:hypothetical protein